MTLPVHERRLAPFVYAHFPFCDVICHYCDFYTARTKGARQEEFFAALRQEAQQALPHLAPQLEAVYLGGGTPGVSPLTLLESFLKIFRDRLSPETEITLEANPSNVTADSARAWKEMGINRVSLGIQSLNDEVLKRLGRVHSGREALEALSLARQEIGNVSGDLIYGVPGQEEAEPAAHAKAFAEAGATHVSAYHLTIPQTHFLYAKLPTDEHAWRQIQALAETLAGKGFHHYEVSNFSLPGYHSRNNSNYWRGGPYWALGPSASGFDGQSLRWKNVADWEEYVRRIGQGQSPREEEERLSPEQRQIEALFTSLRTSQGLDLAWFRREFGLDLQDKKGDVLASLEKDQLGTLSNGHFVLSFRGRMLADEIVRRLL